MTTALEPNYLLIVTVPRGLNVTNLPRPESQGRAVLRSEPVGAQLYAHRIFNIGGVEYALLVPRNPLQPEWVRVSEADGRTHYVEAIPIKNTQSDPLVAAIDRLTDAIINSKG